MLISINELQKELEEPELVLIDTRSFNEYSDGHIPGAVNLDVFAFHWYDTSKKGLESFRNQAQKIFSFVGISEKKKVVFYDEISGMLASRGVWLLMHFSHSNVFMLDGGISKWKKDGLPIETKTNGFKPLEFRGKTNDKVIVGFEYIRDNFEKLKILDVRSKEEFEGSVYRAAQRGHIPNSVNIDWNQNIASDGTLKSNDELEKLYDFPKDSEIVTYCQGAYRAANTFLVLKKLGFKNVRVYLGSWGEWGNKLELPVEN